MKVQVEQAINKLRAHAARHAMNGNWDIADALKIMLDERCELINKVRSLEKLEYKAS